VGGAPVVVVGAAVVVVGAAPDVAPLPARLPRPVSVAAVVDGAEVAPRGKPAVVATCRGTAAPWPTPMPTTRNTLPANAVNGRYRIPLSSPCQRPDLRAKFSLENGRRA